MKAGPAGDPDEADGVIELLVDLGQLESPFVGRDIELEYPDVDEVPNDTGKAREMRLVGDAVRPPGPTVKNRRRDKE
jgi:hypothetical protein